MFSISQLSQRLQQNNEKAFYLAFLRVAISVWLLKELLFRWPAFELLYSNNSFFSVKPGVPYIFYGYMQSIKEHYMLLIWLCMLLLVLNIFGIGRNLVSVLVFFSFAILKLINARFSNGGDIMALLLTFYLAGANTFSHFTLFKRKPLSWQNERLYNMLSNLLAYSIMINLCFVYFMSALGKINDPLWRSGMAIHYFINNEHYFLFAGNNKTIELPKVVLYALNYGTIILELAAPFLVWFRRFRSWVLFLLLLMHSFIFSFFMLYGMSVIFVLQYGLFYSEAELKVMLQKVKGIFKRGKKSKDAL
ncbi:MAG: HTTM domain-containing protein [Bacteroidota bacterium]